MLKKRPILFFMLGWLLMCSTSESLYAQTDTLEVKPFFIPFNINKLTETKWKYTHTLHLSSQSILHTADASYQYFLYFKYNYTYQQFLNGKLVKGVWSLSDDQLFYPFKQNNSFKIASVDNQNLVLEFSPKNSKGKFQYHFVRATEDESPFIRPRHELPLVNVERKKKKKWWWFGRSRKKKEVIEKEPDPTYISIELIGGGYYGGIDPVVKDYIQIKPTGRLIQEFQSVNRGLIVTKRNIEREELELFAEYVQDQKFFEFERMYDCNSSLCQKRKKNKPRPVPLRLAIAYGNQKNVVTIGIWGKDHHNVRYVEYPPQLDNIIDAIQRMAHRMDRTMF